MQKSKDTPPQQSGAKAPQPTEGRHLADKRSPAGARKTAEFMRLSRAPRETFHVSRESASSERLSQFLRIERGRTT